MRACCLCIGGLIEALRWLVDAEWGLLAAGGGWRGHFGAKLGLVGPFLGQIMEAVWELLEAA